MIHVPGKTFAVQAVSHDGSQAEIGLMLTDILEGELLKYDHNLQPDKTSPAITIMCTITHFETPPPQPFSQKEPDYENGRMTEVVRNYQKYTGAIDVSYRVVQHEGKILDSDNLSAKYMQDFAEGSNQAVGQQKSLLGDLGKISPFKKKTSNAPPPPPPAPPSQAQMRQDLLERIAMQITARLVNTDEPVEVLLARGKLDDNNRLADTGLWTRDLETLETMPALPTPQEDAYRLYNIGVADEALAYQAEDHAAAKKYLEQAAINYGKAIDARPSEKYFLEPQNRIESALAHYKKLEDRENAAKQPPAPEPPVKVVDNTKGSKSPMSPAGLKEKVGPPASGVLTNAKIVQMVKSGVSEDSIVAAINHAASIKLDVSADGLIELANNGIKGKIPEAMIERANRPKTATAPKATPPATPAK